MKKQIAIGAAVSVEGRYVFGGDTKRTGTLIGELASGLLLINFGKAFNGHDGHGYALTRGEFDGSSNLWYVPADYVTELPDPIAPAAPPAHSKQQNDRILKHLLAGKSITQLEAFGVYRIFRLAARIHELKNKGHKIVTTMRTDETGKPYAEYKLVTARRA